MPCFTPGIVTLTTSGERAVEELEIGDRVVTREHGLQEIRWIGARVLSFGELNAMPHLKPVLLRTGSLGRDLPETDTLLSPNHRVLVPREKTALHFDERDALVAAKHLVGGHLIRPVEVLGVTYLHLYFDRHETILTNGAWSEAFHPGDASLGARGNAQRGEIFEIFPDLRQGGAPAAAQQRRLRREAMLLEFSR
jgi:hypothetical protein